MQKAGAITVQVGSGILEAMAARGDHPLRDSEFLTNTDGSSYERGLGALGYYHASNATGTWQVVLEPFPAWFDKLTTSEPLILSLSKGYIDLRRQLPTRHTAHGEPVEPYPQRPITGVDLYVLHYTATPPETTVLSIATYQTGPRANLQFPAIAYHLVVDAQGALYLCHDFATRVWGSDGMGVNTRAVHACYTGNHEPSALQLAGLRAGLLLAERELGRPLTVEGHKDRSKTACPGPTWPAWKGALLN